MALYEKQTRLKPGTRSNTKLIVSGGDSPAEKWAVDPSLPTLFIYDYAPPAEKEVVISKGMMVAVGPKTRDRDTGAYINTLTIADGDVAGKHAAGMAPYNFSRQYQEFLYGAQPSIITREYVELPLFRKPEDSAAVKWGTVYGADLKPNDFVKVAGSSTGNAGKLTKWDPATDGAHLIVGQVLAIQDDQEPFGWLKWAMWDEAARREDQGPSRHGYSGPGLDGYPFDPEYRQLDQYANKGYQSPYTTDPTGIPGLLDGSQKAQTQQTVTENVPSGTYATTPRIINLLLKNIVAGSVQAFLDGNPLVEGTDFDVDYANGLVFYKKDMASAGDVTINFRAHFFGTPAGWDFKGAVGAARILLKF
jgi:hypothetical protein